MPGWVTPGLFNSWFAATWLLMPLVRRMHCRFCTLVELAGVSFILSEILTSSGLWNGSRVFIYLLTPLFWNKMSLASQI